MDKEIIERLEKIEKDLAETKQQILTEFAVYTHKVDMHTHDLTICHRYLKSALDKLFDYKNYFDYLNKTR